MNRILSGPDGGGICLGSRHMARALVAQTVKNPSTSAGDPGSISGLGRSPGEENGNPLQYS